MPETIDRREPRKALKMDVQLRTVDCAPNQVAVSDLSEHGCCIRISSLSLKLDNRVLLRPEGFESFVGTVVWVDDGNAGIQFDSPLHRAIVDHLCKEHQGLDQTVNIAFAA